MQAMTGASATSPAETALGLDRITKTVGSHSYRTRALADKVALLALAKQPATQLAFRQALVFARGFVRSAP